MKRSATLKFEWLVTEWNQKFAALKKRCELPQTLE
jgi:hypothetical protein